MIANRYQEIQRYTTESAKGCKYRYKENKLVIVSYRFKTTYHDRTEPTQHNPTTHFENMDVRSHRCYNSYTIIPFEHIRNEKLRDGIILIYSVFDGRCSGYYLWE